MYHFCGQLKKHCAIVYIRHTPTVPSRMKSIGCVNSLSNSKRSKLNFKGRGGSQSRNAVVKRSSAELAGGEAGKSGKVTVRQSVILY